MDEQLCRATPQESATCAAVIRAAFLEIAERFHLNVRNCPTHPSNCTPEWVKEAMAKGVEYYLLTQYQQAIGCVALLKANRDVFYMERLSVLPEFRGRGYGRMLVDFCIEQALQRGAKRLEAGLNAEQTELVEWYRHMGFRFKQRARLHHLPYSLAFLYYDLQEVPVYDAETA